MAPIYLIAAAGRTPVAAASAAAAARAITRATARGTPMHDLYAEGARLSARDCARLARAIIASPRMNAYFVRCEVPVVGRLDCNVIQRLARPAAADNNDASFPFAA